MDYIPVYNFDLLPVLLALVFIASVVLWVAIRNYSNFILMFFLIPLTLYAGWTIYTTVDRLLGYPVVDSMEPNTIYITHLEDPNGDWIFVWIVKPGEPRPKAIMIPKTENNERQMSDAQERSENGIPQMIQPAVNGGGMTKGGEVNTYDFVPTGQGDALKDEQREMDAQEERERLEGPRIPGPEPRDSGGPMPGPLGNNGTNDNRNEIMPGPAGPVIPIEDGGNYRLSAETTPFEPEIPEGQVNPYEVWDWPTATEIYEEEKFNKKAR